jgi:hypothetical protein
LAILGLLVGAATGRVTVKSCCASVDPGDQRMEPESDQVRPG